MKELEALITIPASPVVPLIAELFERAPPTSPFVPVACQGAPVDYLARGSRRVSKRLALTWPNLFFYYTISSLTYFDLKQNVIHFSLKNKPIGADDLKYMKEVSLKLSLNKKLF